MSFPIVARGELRFFDGWSMEAGLDAFLVRSVESPVNVEHFRREEHWLYLDFTGKGLANAWDGTVDALRALAAHSMAGNGFDVALEVEHAKHVQIPPGYRMDHADLPPHHYRWELYFAARDGLADRVEACVKGGLDLQTKLDEHGHTARNLARLHGHHAIEERLASLGG
ncbi:MAG: hypothetical protein H6721_20775 [Sandaracinus sp.]|nr:hypothetical protein [Sandaracinus sp.]MCB9634566.1 hypothetical protein [Sandaracinus sp.]